MRKASTIFILACSLMLNMLTGCKVGPNYQRPEVDSPESFDFEFPDAQDTLNMAWWNQFEDPILESLILEALANNKDVKIAAGNIESAVGILMQIWAPLFPQIGYGGQYMRTHNSRNLTSVQIPTLPPPFNFDIPATQTTWQALLNLSWQVDIWGRTRRLIESAQANVYANYEARQNVILSLVASVANSYIQLRGLDEQLVISIRTAKSYYESVHYFKLQFKYGQGSQIGVVQAETQYQIAASKIPQIKSQIVQTENAINVLLGRNPQPIARGKTIYDLNLPAVPSDIPSELLHQRPDIVQAEQNLILANAQIGAAEALYFPSITLTGFYGGASQQLHNLFTGPANTWNFTGAITGPIFTWGAIYGQVIEAKGETEAALQNYEKSIINAFADVQDALVDHTMLIEQLAAEEKLVTAAGEYQRLATLQYKGGYAPYFIVIQAQQQYFPAELARAQTRAEVFTSLVNIYQSMGGGWVDSAAEMTSSLFGECGEANYGADNVGDSYFDDKANEEASQEKGPLNLKDADAITPLKVHGDIERTGQTGPTVDESALSMN